MRVVRVFRGFIPPLLSSLPGTRCTVRARNKKPAVPIMRDRRRGADSGGGLRQSMTLRAR
jgi:hypothetical protein